MPSAGAILNLKISPEPPAPVFAFGEAIMKSSLRQTATPQHRSRPRGNDRPHAKWWPIIKEFGIKTE
jgi:hypothetical protein